MYNADSEIKEYISINIGWLTNRIFTDATSLVINLATWSKPLDGTIKMCIRY